MIAAPLLLLALAAEPEPGVDVTLAPEPAPRRYVSVAWNPMPLFTIGKVSADVQVALLEHHALVLNAFYTSTQTAPIYTFDDAGNAVRLPKQTFVGWGGEVGYRYYSREGGLRGFFVGPSLIFASLTATAENGTKTPFVDYGAALDVGFQALIADDVLLSLGTGVQYLGQNTAIPPQQFPARLYANSGVLPRFLLSIGWAF